MKYIVSTLLLSVALLVSGCTKQDQKKTEQKLQQAGEKAGEAAQKAGDKIEKAAGKAGDAVKDAADKHSKDSDSSKPPKPSPEKPKR